MPYYCTVPRCTSMAGKAKNVSFHQFPRDEELAKLWNRILKRGKPYTKYSKVCSLHFKPEDYTVTSVGKNKGQWRTLRKDAVPSQNLPSDSPAPYTRRHSSAWVPSLSPNLVDPMVQQQMAQAIYMQTMLAMQAATTAEPPASNEQMAQPELSNPSPSGSSLSEIELLLRRTETEQKEETYRCLECSKCFKDPDVFILHKRVHTNTIMEKLPNIEKENYSANIQDSEETLRANPILANLLKSSIRLEPESNLETNVLTIENQIMSALTSNMEAYIRTLSSMLSNQRNTEDKLSEDLDESEDVGNVFKEDSADSYKHEDECGESEICEAECQDSDKIGDKSNKCDDKNMHSDELISGDEVNDTQCDEKDAYQHVGEKFDAVNEKIEDGSCEIKDQVGPDCDSNVGETLDGLN